jgi:hypothetical protein
MPRYDIACQNDACEQFGVVREATFHMDESAPACQSCGVPQEKQVTLFNMAFSGSITARYNDPKLEGAHVEGHWMYERNTPDGKPKPVFIDTWQKQREFCKRENLVPPTQSGPLHISADGMSVNGRGLPGCEV